MMSSAAMQSRTLRIRTMAVQQDPMKMLTEKWQDSKKTQRTRLRKVAFDDTVHKTYVKQVQPVVLREIRKKSVRHIVQPIIHEISDEAEHVEDFVRPVSFREIHEDVPDHVHDQITQNQYTISKMIDNQESSEEPHEEEHFQEDQVQEVVHEEVSNDVQPIVRRKINRRVRVDEVQPVHEIVHRIDQVGDVEVRQPIDESEWRSAQSHASDDEDAGADGEHRETGADDQPN